jgi:probable rRNA maturation factor
MILLDQDLDPHPASSTAARSGLTARKATDRQLRLPSARSLAQFLRNAQGAVRLQGQVTVLLTTDNSIRRLNRQFRGIDQATDVLSFPAAETAFSGIVGDIAISVPTARRQADEQGNSLADEVKVLILHGLLHLAGLDHERDNGRMERRERLLRANLGLPQGLIERSEGDGLQTDGKRGNRRSASIVGGEDCNLAKSSSGAKAPPVSRDLMYGLKPVPSRALKPVPSSVRKPAFSTGLKPKLSSVVRRSRKP